MTSDFVPFHPDVSLAAMLGYGLFAFAFALLMTPWFVSFLIRNKVGKQLRVETIDGREPTIFRTYHQNKAGTPAMGGLLIWGSILVTVLFSRLLSYFGIVEHSLLSRGQVYIPLFALVAFGLLGAVDDWLNIKGVGKKRGLEALPKIFFLLLISSICAVWFYRIGYSAITIPYFRTPLELGVWYVPLFIFIVVGTANAVNFTDGLDGLASGLLVIAFGSLAILAYLHDLSVLAAFCTVCVGAIAAFLWHNVPPAIFFMTDTGSMALGGTLGVIAMMIDQALILPFVGFVFVLEMLSVIIQLTSKKLRGGKKIFIAAPLHHHFEALEWGESKVTMRLWIIGGFMAFLGIILAVMHA